MKIFAVIFFLFLLKQGLSSRQKRTINPDFENTEILTISESDDNVRINCNFYGTEIWILNEFLQTNVSIENIASVGFWNLPDLNPIPGCDFPVTSGQDVRIELSQFGECAASVAKDFDENLLVQYVLCIFPGSTGSPILYTRDVPTAVQFGCLYSSQIWGTLVIKPEIKKIALPAEEAPGTFGVKFRQCNESSCEYPEPTNEVVAGARAFFGLEICGGENLDIILQVINCWTTSESDPESSPSYRIIEGGCVVPDSKLPDSNQIYENFVSHQAAFSFVAFIWSILTPAQQRVYLHCDVRFCPTSINNCSADVPSCDSVSPNRKRSISEVEDGEVMRKSFGPIEVKICNKVELGCSHDCSISEKEHVPFCTCPDGFVLEDDLRTCEEATDSSNEVDFVEVSYETEPVPSVINEEFVMDLSYLMYGLIVGIVIASSLVCWLFRKKQNQKLPLPTAAGLDHI